MQKTQENRGVQIEARKSQLIASIVIVFIMLVLPIGGYEYMTRETNDVKEVYTQSAVAERQGEDTGRVAGISTEKKPNIFTETIDIASSSRSVILIVGVVLVVLSVIFSLALLYDFSRA